MVTSVHVLSCARRLHRAPAAFPGTTRWRTVTRRESGRKTVWSRNGPPRTTSLTVAPRNHGRLLPAAPDAAIINAVAAGTCGRRANTKDATAAVAAENTSTLQAAAKVAQDALRPPDRQVDRGAVRDDLVRDGPPGVRPGTAFAATSRTHASIGCPSTATTTSPLRTPAAGASIGSMRTPAADQASS
jgi:hypothetical protein